MPKAGYTQLSYYQKLHLKEMLEEKRYTKIKMAEKLHVSKSTIYNEIKRGTINGVYDPKYSESKRLKAPRPESMFKKDPELALYISKLIIEENMGPEKIVDRLKEETDRFKEYPTCQATIYSAIGDGLIPNVTPETLRLQRNGDVVRAGLDTIYFPELLRKKLKIKKGNRYKVECRKNGDIVLKKLKGN